MNLKPKSVPNFDFPSNPNSKYQRKKPNFNDFSFLTYFLQFEDEYIISPQSETSRTSDNRPQA